MRELLLKADKEKRSIFKITVLVLLFFGANLFLSFATDTYLTFADGFSNAAEDMLLRNGRPVIALIYWLHSLSGLSGITFYFISSGLSLLFLGISVWLYQKLLGRYGLSENLRILLAFASIANIYIIEYFLFIEKCGFMLAVLLNVIAVWCVCASFTAQNPPLPPYTEFPFSCYIGHDICGIYLSGNCCIICDSEHPVCLLSRQKLQAVCP